MLRLISLALLTICAAHIHKEDLSRKRRSTGSIPRQVVKVTENVYVALGGKSLGNSIMILAPEGLIIVDTGDSQESASLMLQDFRNISSAPVKAIIYTHNHNDHTGGATAFVENPASPPDIWAHKDLSTELESYFIYAAKARFVRTIRQFGVFVKGSQNSVDFGKEGSTFSFLYPNKLINNTEADVVIAGLPVRLVPIVSETTDHVGVYIPQWKMFMCGDLFYDAFPNLYTIRGAPVRDPISWIKSLDYVIDLGLDYLVPSHLFPIIGNQAVLDALVPYRDGIQFVHDQALRYINKGLTPNEVARKVKLPSTLVNVSSLQEDYGMVEWSVKGVFQLYLGWFSGQPMDLLPLSLPEKAIAMADLVNGTERLAVKAKAELDRGNLNWALELASYTLIADPSNMLAKAVKIGSLNMLADQQINSNAKNYLKTSALETSGLLNLMGQQNSNSRNHLINTLDVRYIFGLLPSAFTPEKCENKTFSVVFNFTDTGRIFSLQNRNSVAIVKEGKIPENFTMKIDTTEGQFKHFVMMRTGSSPDTQDRISNKLGVLKTCFEL